MKQEFGSIANYIKNHNKIYWEFVFRSMNHHWDDHHYQTMFRLLHKKVQPVLLWTQNKVTAKLQLVSNLKLSGLKEMFYLEKLPTKWIEEICDLLYAPCYYFYVFPVRPVLLNLFLNGLSWGSRHVYKCFCLY